MKLTAYQDIMIVCNNKILNEIENNDKHCNWFSTGELPSVGDTISFENRLYSVQRKHFKVEEARDGYATILAIIVDEVSDLSNSNSSK